MRNNSVAAVLSLVTSLLCVFLFPASAMADCPDTNFISPTGQGFVMGSSFEWSDLQCETNGSLLDKAVASSPNGCPGKVNEWKGRADGCSVPIPGLDSIWNGVFHGACDLHDLCYSSLGHSKEQCDKWFETNLLATCSLPGLGNVAIGACTASAGAMYAGVAAGGQSSFDNDQSWATSNCSN